MCIRDRSKGTQFVREAVASAPGQVFAYHWKANRKGQISFKAKLSRQERAVTRSENGDFVISGELDNGSPTQRGVGFEGRLRVVAKGCLLYHSDAADGGSR